MTCSFTSYKTSKPKVWGKFGTKILRRRHFTIQEIIFNFLLGQTKTRSIPCKQTYPKMMSSRSNRDLRTNFRDQPYQRQWVKKKKRWIDWSSTLNYRFVLAFGDQYWKPAELQQFGLVLLIRFDFGRYLDFNQILLTSNYNTA